MKEFIKNLFKKEEIINSDDLKPRGIKSTIKSDNHGTNEHYNSTWIDILSQRRNFEKFEKEYGIKIK